MYISTGVFEAKGITKSHTMKSVDNSGSHSSTVDGGNTHCLLSTIKPVAHGNDVHDN